MCDICFEDEKECYICINCAKDNKLKKYIKLKNDKITKCHFCEENNLCIQIIENYEFLNFLRALVRYHYWEDNYNTHFGGYSLHELLMEKDNYIFNNQRFVKGITCQDNIICGMENYKFDDDEIVELYYGHSSDGHRMSFGEAKKNESHPYINQIKEELLKTNYFLLENDFYDTLKKYEKYFSSTLEKNIIFYRARIGYKEKVKNNYLYIDYTDLDSFHKYIPYKYKEISAPPIIKTNQGRLNRQNVSFLYLATTKQTAISEVRPHPSHKVSIGCFKLTKSIKVADFDYAFIKLSSNENLLEKYNFLNHIDKLLSMPITPEDNHFYLVTQFFSDSFRKLGFDAISYRSSVASGQNILVFNPALFKYIEKDSSVFYIENLKYTYKCIS